MLILAVPPLWSCLLCRFLPRSNASASVSAMSAGAVLDLVKPLLLLLLVAAMAAGAVGGGGLRDGVCFALVGGISNE
jgi:hypothetical protein